MSQGGPGRLVNLKGNPALRRRQHIPYRIVQTFKPSQVPIPMWYNAHKWHLLNPEYDYYFYSDNDILQYLDGHTCHDFDFTADQLKTAYHKIKPGAGKADLFRFLVIYDGGGCYFDLDTTCRAPLQDYLGPDDEVLSGIGRIRGDFHQYGLIYTAKHPIMKRALELAVQNILSETFIDNERYLEYLCGPPCLDLAVREVLGVDRWYQFKPGKHQLNGINFTLLGGDCFDGQVDFKYHGYRRDLHQLNMKYWPEEAIFEVS